MNRKSPTYIAPLPALLLLAVSASANANPAKLVPIGGSVSSGTSYTGATDGDPNTIWNSGGWAPAWIQLDLGQAMPISKIRLLVEQDRPGPANHVISVGANLSSMRTVYSYTGSPADNSWLEFGGDGLNGDHLGHVRYVRITTNSDPAWVGWREIEIYGALEYFGYFGMTPDNIPATAAAGANLMYVNGTDPNVASGPTSILATVGQYHAKAVVMVQSVAFSGRGLTGGASCSATDPGCWRYNWKNS